jgi:hypothetical protein
MIQVARRGADLVGRNTLALHVEFLLANRFEHSLLWISSMNGRHHFRYTLRQFLLVLTMLVAVIGGAVVLLDFAREAFWKTGPLVEQIPFDRDAWRAVDPQNPTTHTVRSEMIDDLIQNYDLQGWTEDKVLQLLGNPTKRNNTSREFIYVIGTDRQFGIDIEELVISFDSESTVVDVKLRYL